MKSISIASLSGLAVARRLLCAPLLLAALTGPPCLAKAPPQTTLSLDSPLPFHAVRVPFTYKDAMICLPARVNGRPVDCTIDTGRDNTAWASSQDFRADPAGGTTQVLSADKSSVPARRVSLPEVQVGSLTLRDLRTDEVDAAPPSKSAPNIYEFGLVLGTNAFEGLSLTVDYARQEIVLRDATYRADRHPPAPGDCLCPFHWLRGPNSLGRGLAFLDGAAIAGRPVSVVVDTGWYPAGQGLSQYVYDRLRRDGLAPGGGEAALLNTSQSLYQTQCVRGVAVDVGAGFRVTGPSYLLPFGAGDAGVVLGAVGIGYTRLTFDFPHRRILFSGREAAPAPGPAVAAGGIVIWVNGVIVKRSMSLGRKIAFAKGAIVSDGVPLVDVPADATVKIVYADGTTITRTPVGAAPDSGAAASTATPHS